MNRQHYTWYSPWLQRTMDLLVFGHAGKPVLFFPTRTARYYDYESWKVIDGIADKIEDGSMQVYCVDSVDRESFYNKEIPPHERVPRHFKYERYILDEVMRLIRKNNPWQKPVVAGCSLGAYHAANIAFRYPLLFSRVVCMSGRFDLTIQLEYFEDLLEGYRDDNVYFNMPSQFMPNIVDERILHQLRKLYVVLVVGQQDAFLPNNIQMDETLSRLQIPHEFHLWEEEAHKAKYWKKMVGLYL